MIFQLILWKNRRINIITELILNSNYAHMKANSEISLSQDQKSWKAADAFIIHIKLALN